MGRSDGLGPLDFDRLAALVDGGAGIDEVDEDILGRVIQAYGLAEVSRILRERSLQDAEARIVEHVSAMVGPSREFVDRWAFRQWEMPVPSRPIEIPPRTEDWETPFDLWTAGGYRPTPMIHGCIWRPEHFARPVLVHRFDNERQRAIAWTFFIPGRAGEVPGVERTDRWIPSGLWGTEELGSFRFGTLVHVRADETVAIGATGETGVLEFVWADRTGEGFADAAWTRSGASKPGRKRLPLLVPWTEAARRDADRVLASLTAAARE